MNPIGNRQSPIGNVSLVTSDNPWPGLESFTEDARSFFFGREAETDQLSRLVRRQTLTILFGQSGLGKSSLLQAGLFPILRESDHLPLYLRLDHSSAIADCQVPIADLPPGATSPIGNRQSPIGNDLVNQVKLSLNAAFAAAKADAPAFSDDETLWEYFHRKDVDIWSAKNRLLTPVLAFDQFEEIFTLGRTDAACRERSRLFLDELACLVENRPPAAVKAKLDAGTLDPARFNFEKPSCQVILSLREDFLPDLESLKQEMPALIHNRLRLKKLNGVQALEVVSRPAPHLLADGVAERIVEFVAGARGGSAERLAELDVEPPLLSVICRELNDRRRALGAAQITVDLVSGNRREILTDFYERSVADLPAPMRAFVEDHLLTKSGFRDNLALETALEFPGVTRPLLDTLVARRLLRIEDRLGVQRVELTHDVLAEVVRGSRDARQQRQTLDAARRHTRNLRFVVTGLALAVAGLLAGAFWGIRSQRRSAAQASQTDLVLASRLLDEGKLGEGIAYLVRAGRKDPANPLVAPRLISTLTNHRFLLPSAAPFASPSNVVAVSYSGDGRRIYVQGEDLVVHVIDTEAWRETTTLELGQKIARRAIATPADNGTAFAVILEDESIVVCDGATNQPRFPALRPPEPVVRWANGVSNFGFSRDGRWLIAGSATHVRAWDASTGELRLTLPGKPDWDVSPDGRLIATNRGGRTTLTSIADQATVGEPHESSDEVWYYEFSGDGRRLMIRHEAGATVCDVPTGRPLHPAIALGRASSTYISHDGARLLRIRGRTVEVVDVASGQPAYPALQHGGNVRQLRLLDQGRILFTNGVDGSVRFWEFATGRLLAEPSVRQPRYTPAAVSQDGRSVVLFAADGRAYPMRLGGPPVTPLALLRDSSTTLRVNVLPDPPARLSWLTPTSRLAIDFASGQVTTGSFTYPEPVVAIARDTYGSTLGAGDVLVAKTRAGEIRIWTLGPDGVANNVPMEAPPPQYSGNVTNANFGFAIDAARQRVAFPLGNAEVGNNERLGIWDTVSGRQIAMIDAGKPVIASSYIAFTPDGGRVAFLTSDREAVHVYDLATGRKALAVEDAGTPLFSTYRFSPDGQRLITGDTEGSIQIWNASTGELLRSSQYHRTTVNRFDYAPDQRYYSSISSDGTAQVWDAETDAPVGALRELTGTVSRADFSPDSARLATGANPGIARVWDVQTGLPLSELTPSFVEVTGLVAFAPDGRFLAAHPGVQAGNRPNVQLVPVPPSDAGRTPDWLLTLATICAQVRLTDEGKLVGAMEEFARIADVQRALANSPASDPYAEWSRWILSDSPDRSIGPGFSITPVEAAQRALETPSADGW